MRLKSEEIITAEVILRAGSGSRTFHGPTESGENSTRDHDEREPGPPPAALVTVLGTFQALGFEMGDLRGMSFPISGRVEKFAAVFRTDLRRNAVGSLECLDESGLPSLELPLSSLPGGVTRFIETIVFLPPEELLPGTL